MVIQGHCGFLLCTCKNQATALGKATSKVSFEKERCGSVGSSPLLHTRALLGQAIPLRAVLQLGSRVQGVLATGGLRPINGSHEDSAASERSQFSQGQADEDRRKEQVDNCQPRVPVRQQDVRNCRSGMTEERSEEGKTSVTGRHWR